MRRAFSPSIADSPSTVKMKSPLGRSTVLSYGWAATTTPPSSFTFASTSPTGQGVADPKSWGGAGTFAGSGKKQR